MGLAHNKSYSFSQQFNILETIADSSTLHLLQDRFTQQQYLGRELTSNDEHEAYEIECIIQEKLHNPSPFVTRLLKSHSGVSDSYCSDARQFYLLYGRVSRLLADEIRDRRAQGRGFQLHEVDEVLNRVAKGLKYLYNIFHGHGAVSSRAITWPALSNEPIQLVDQWAMPASTPVVQKKSLRPSTEAEVNEKNLLLSMDLEMLGGVCREMLSLLPLQKYTTQQLYQQVLGKVNILSSASPSHRVTIYNLVSQHAESRRIDVQSAPPQNTGLMQNKNSNQPHPFAPVRSGPPASMAVLQPQPASNADNNHLASHMSYAASSAVGRAVERVQDRSNSANRVHFEARPDYSRNSSVNKVNLHPTSSLAQPPKPIVPATNPAAHRVNFGTSNKVNFGTNRTADSGDGFTPAGHSAGGFASIRNPFNTGLEHSSLGRTSQTYNFHKPSAGNISLSAATGRLETGSKSSGLHYSFGQAVTTTNNLSTVAKIDQENLFTSPDFFAKLHKPSLQPEGPSSFPSSVNSSLTSNAAAVLNAVTTGAPHTGFAEGQVHSILTTKLPTSPPTVSDFGHNSLKITQEGSSVQQEQFTGEVGSRLTPAKPEGKGHNPFSTIPEVSERSQSARSDEDKEYVIEEYENGSRYEGFKSNGMRNGKGKFYYQEGSFYDGEWKNNNMHGFGRLYYSNKKLAYEGEWFIDQFHGKGRVYNDEPAPIFGFYDYTNFENLDEKWKYYEGDLVCDAKEGEGKLVLSNDEYMEGQFKNDKVHGRGRFVTKNGEVINGVWSESLLVQKI